VLRKTLLDDRRALVWWGAGLALLVAMMVSLYPSIHDNPGLTKLVQDLPKAAKGLLSFGGEFDYSTPAGYLGRELFSFTVPLLFLIVGITSGARAIAGEEEVGTLDLLLSLPLSRRRLALDKLGALALELFGLAFVLWLALVAGARGAGMHIAVWNLASATLAALLLGLAFAGVAFLLGAAGLRRAAAAGAAGALAVAAYFVNGLTPLVSWLAPLQKTSPFYWYSAGDALRTGLDAHLSLLLVLFALASAASLAAFDRRDVRAA